MRLVCPNCEAVYEVPSDVIPQAGRDVQCTNCGRGWYVGPDGQEVDLDTLLPPDAADPPREPVPQVAESPSPQKSREGGGSTFVVNAPPPPKREEPGAQPSRRPLEDQVKRVLQAEAEYEAQARFEEQTLERQEDLPLDTPQRRPTDDIDLQAIATATGVKRRSEFPDIEEINSTLRSTTERSDEHPEPAPTARTRRRKGFRLGLGLMLLICGVLAALYALADPIGARVPALAGPLDSYALAVNDMRVMLAKAVDRAIAIIR